MSAGKMVVWWSAGQTVKGKREGKQTFWNDRGAVTCVAEYERDRAHGVTEFFHPNGEVAVHETYERGEPSGRWWGQRSSAPSDVTWRIVMSSVLTTEPDNPVWRNEMVTTKGGSEKYRFFLRDGTPCNGRGVPHGATAPDLSTSLARFEEASASSDLNEVLVLAEACAQEILSSAKDVRWLLPKKLAIKQGPVAPPETIAEIEQVHGPLPASYRAFLERYGQLRFPGDHAREIDTADPKKILRLTRASAGLVDWLAEGMEEDDELAVDDFRKLEVGGSGGWLPPEQRSGPLLRVSADESDGFVLALTLRDEHDEAPFFGIAHDDPYFYLVGRDATSWVRTLCRHWLSATVADVTRAYSST